jgi:hypothetical protein
MVRNGLKTAGTAASAAAISVAVRSRGGGVRRGRGAGRRAASAPPCGRITEPIRPNRSTAPWVLSISPPGLMSSAAPPGAIATWTPPSKLSLVILAVESDGSLTSGSRLSFVTAR